MENCFDFSLKDFFGNFTKKAENVWHKTSRSKFKRNISVQKGVKKKGI